MSKREFLFYSSLIEQSRYMTQFFKVLNKGFFFLFSCLFMIVMETLSTMITKKC